MILLNEVAKSGPYMQVYKDSQDPYLFYYIPRFAELAKRDDGKYIFGMMRFKKDPNDPEDGFSVYNMTVRGVMPQGEYTATKQELEKQVGHSVSIVPIPGFNLSGEPLVDLSFAQIGGKVQQQGGNLFTDLAMSFTFQEWCEPDMAQLFMSDAGWTGVLKYKLTGLLTPFRASITANWRRVQDHFKAQSSVSHWFVSSNISYETQRLIERDVIHIDITGGTPSQREKVYSIAKQTADRLFVPTIQPNPLPSHPSGGIYGLSLNYSRVEEDRTSEWTTEEHDFETRDLGMAIVVGRVPSEYFHGLSKALTYSRNEPIESQAESHLRRFLEGVRIPRE